MYLDPANYKDALDWKVEQLTENERHRRADGQGPLVGDALDRFKEETLARLVTDGHFEEIKAEHELYLAGRHPRYRSTQRQTPSR